jgi:hypothetical protein
MHNTHQPTPAHHRVLVAERLELGLVALRVDAILEGLDDLADRDRRHLHGGGTYAWWRCMARCMVEVHGGGRDVIE